MTTTSTAYVEHELAQAQCVGAEDDVVHVDMHGELDALVVGGNAGGHHGVFQVAAHVDGRVADRDVAILQLREEVKALQLPAENFVCMFDSRGL